MRFVGLFFFFQAEDGIRDRNVTGVQTCALPISLAPGTITSNVDCGFGVCHTNRSEERRVGKSVDLGGRRIIKKKKKRKGRCKEHIIKKQRNVYIGSSIE